MSNAVLSNITSLNLNRDLNIGLRQAKSSDKVSTNMKTNHATGAAAGVSISEQMRMQTMGVEQVDKNSQDGINLTQAAESAIHEMQDIVQNMQNLTLQIDNNALNATERDALEFEINQLALELENIVESREFNGTPLLDAGTDLEDNAIPNNITIQNGVNPNEKLTISLPNFNTSAKQPGPVVNLILEHVLVVEDTRTIEERLYSIEGAFLELSTARSDLVAIHNRLEESISNLQMPFENTRRELSELEARIRDTDMAHDVLARARVSMLEQSSATMLAQANQAPQSTLQLLQ